MLRTGVVYYVLVLRRNQANNAVGRHRLPYNSAGYNGYTHLAFLSLLIREKSNARQRLRLRSVIRVQFSSRPLASFRPLHMKDFSFQLEVVALNSNFLVPSAVEAQAQATRYNASD